MPLKGRKDNGINRASSPNERTRRQAVSRTTGSEKRARPALLGAQSPATQRDYSYLKALILDGDQKDRVAIESLIGEIVDDDQPGSIFVLLEAVIYFESLGDAYRAVELAKVGLSKSLSIENISLQRKAYNIAGFCYSRIGDYKQALACLEQALKIAIELKEPVFEFAVLCNIVGVLQIMGLLEDAKSLSVRLLKYPQGSAEFDYLHLQNAINGLQLSSRIGDEVNAKRFDELARAKLQSAGLVGRPWKAYVDANRCLWMLRQEKLTEALEFITKAVAERSAESNFRENVILFCALASCALRNGNQNLVIQCKRLLDQLLDQTIGFAPHREDVLRTLVELYSADETVEGRRVRSVYLRRLREHIINVKHRQFFRGLHCADERPALRIHPPVYEVPSHLATLATLSSHSGGRLRFDFDDDFSGVRLSASSSQTDLDNFERSSSFNLAVDWAVASDFLAGRSGHHCFQIGQFSGLLALQLGRSVLESSLIDMACRLHDIGKIVVSESLHMAFNSGDLDDYLIIREHTIAGAELLSVSTEPVFIMATKIARHHHEWWNGCGYPDGLKGAAIPIEARICHISDYYFGLLFPPDGRFAWNFEDAIRQVISMGGIQFDPDLISAFVEAAESAKESGMYDAEVTEKLNWVNSLCGARKSLLKVVDSI